MTVLAQVSVPVGHPKGLHARVAATLVKLAAEASDRLGVRFALGHAGRAVPADNLFALLSLNVRRGDTVTLAPDRTAAGVDGALAAMAALLANASPTPAAETADAVDEILHEAAVTLDRVVDNLVNGLIVVDSQGIIIRMNQAAEGYLGIRAADALGRNADDVIPNSRLSRVLRTGEPEVARRQMTPEVTLVTNRTPIKVDGRVVGAAALFQDITELERLAGELREVKALKEKLSLLLDSVAECICVTDGAGGISYANPAFRTLFGDPPQWKPDGPLARALAAGQSVLGEVEVTPSGARILEDVHVVKIEGEVHGVVAIGRTAGVVKELADRLAQEEARAEYLAQELVRARPLPGTFSRLIGTSGIWRDALAIAAKAAVSSSTILIRGESGTGKELVAEAIHLASPRAKKPFIRLNCAAIPPTLVESELFGHEKGAFTGATRRRLGKFELADGGTIFLDEIGTLDPTLQAKLLRVLQSRCLERVGGEESIPIDVRVIAATNADLEQMVQGGEFRDDLYYRLNVIAVALPPLRERPGDVPLLVEHFITKLGGQVGRQVQGITPEALRLLMHYDWPGNVRQLENVIERALNLCDGPKITVADLPAFIHERQSAPALVSPLPTGEIAALEAYEREIIRLALARYGSFNAAAKALGITHRTVALKARAFGLDKVDKK